MFSQGFISVLIVGALALTALSVLILLTLIARDYLQKRMW